jgi:hypothetical protein
MTKLFCSIGGVQIKFHNFNISYLDGILNVSVNTKIR